MMNRKLQKLLASALALLLSLSMLCGASIYTPPAKTLAMGDNEINCTIDKQGVATLEPTGTQLNALLKSMPADGVLCIDVSEMKDVTGAVLALEVSKLTAADALNGLRLSVANMQLSVPRDALESMQKHSKTLRFGLTPGPILFTLTDEKGEDIDWYDYRNPVLLSLAYEPTLDYPLAWHAMREFMDEEWRFIPRSWYENGSLYAHVYTAGKYGTVCYNGSPLKDMYGHWAQTATENMAARGIVEGVGNGSFDPNGTITRVQFLTMLMRMLDIANVAATKDIPVTDYDDVPYWAKPNLIDAKAIGITLSGADGAFRPNEPITRQEMFFMVYEAMYACNRQPSFVSTDEKITFSDWDQVDAVYADAIQALCVLELVNGNGDGTLNPNGSSTRAEGTQFLYHFLLYLR